MEVGYEAKDSKQPAPKDLVFDGLHYCKTAINLGELNGLNITTVIEFDHENDDELEPTEAGPELVIFNRAVYRRSETLPADIEDDVLRTVDAFVTSSYYPPPPQFPHLTTLVPSNGPPQPQLQHTSLSQPLFFQRSQVQSMPPPQTGYPLPPQPQFGQFSFATPGLLGNMGPPHVRRVMPPRSQIIDSRSLQYLFDLPVNMRAGLQFRVPARSNYDVAQQNGQPRPQGIQRRSTWDPLHIDYLNELMELAMLTLNRRLEGRDFRAITEALHRRFRGTRIGNVQYPERGYNTIHSYVMKKPEYNTLLSRVLP